MAIFGRKQNGGGFSDVIRCDEPSYLIWKWRPAGTVLGENRKENSIRWGSSLRVKPGEIAIFVYTQPDGEIALDYIEGPNDGILETKNLPVISGLLGLAYAGDTPFQAEVYFINLAQIIQVKFAVPFFDVFDPRFLDFGVPTAVRGTITFKIADYMEFISLHRLDDFSLDTFKAQIKDAVTRYVKSIVANAPEENGIPVVQLERKISEINDLVEERLKARLSKEFGVFVSSVDIGAIEVDKTSEGYHKLMDVTRGVAAQTVQAQTEVQIKEMRDSQKLGIFQRAAKAFTDIKEDTYARHMRTKSGDYSAPAAPVMPPPIPKQEFYVAVNGQAVGPCDLTVLSQMVTSGQVTEDTLVWRQGMTEWAKSREVSELSSLFHPTPPGMPPIPIA